MRDTYSRREGGHIDRIQSSWADALEKSDKKIRPITPREPVRIYPPLWGWCFAVGRHPASLSDFPSACVSAATLGPAQERREKVSFPSGSAGSS